MLKAETWKQRSEAGHPGRRSILVTSSEPMYIDFEGTAVDPPTLLGVLVDDEFTQYVFEPSLAPAARAKSVERGGTCGFATAPEAFADIRRRIEAEDRMARLRVVGPRARTRIVELPRTG